MNAYLKKIKVLVFEDNLGDFILIEENLKEKFPSVEIHHCVSFEECEAKQIDTDYAVILLDLILTDMQRDELVHNVMQKFSNVPIIVLTGFGDIEYARKLLASGVSDFLMKEEISPIILHKTIIYTLERSVFVHKIEQSNKNYQNLFNICPQPIFIIDIQSNQIILSNSAAEQTYKYKKDELRGMSIAQIKKDPTSNNDISMNDSTGKIIAEEEDHILKNGDVIHVEVYKTLFNYNDRLCCVMLINDVTEKNKYIKVIENQNAKFKEIAWSQSHLTRASIARILGILDILDVDSSNKEDLKELVQYIKISADELDNIVKRTVTITYDMREPGEKSYFEMSKDTL